MENKLTNKDYRFFSFLSLFFLCIGWLAFALTLIGFFHFWAIIGGLVVLFGAFGYFLINQKNFQGLSKEFLVLTTLFLLAGLFFVSNSNPTIFSGRDQGSISEAAIRLSQNHELQFSTLESKEFFKVYGQGRALNFPGFHYATDGKLTTQFPLVYTSWLAFFFSLFGVWGLKLANAFLFFFFASAFYLLFRLFSESKYRMVFALLITTSFAFSWFTKLTLSENMAMALLWIGILELVRFLREPRIGSFNLTLLSFGLLFFARVEGIAFLILTVVMMIIFSRQNDFWKRLKTKKILVPLLTFLFLFLANLGRDFYFYKEIGKVLFSQSKNGLPSVFNVWGFLSNITYTGKIFAIYGVISFLVLGLIGLVYFIRNKNWKILIPLFVVLPSFTYLLDANISADHPWMLRRFSFSILPALMLYSFLFLETFLAGKKKNWFPIALGIIFILSFYPFAKFATFSENQVLLESTQKLSAEFGPNDLVLVDRLASGNGWSMPTGPMSFLFGKHSVYFFNPNDLSKIDLQKFEKIYLIVSDENLSFYQNSAIGSRLMNPKNYSLKSSGLDTHELVRLPQKENFTVSGKIFEITK
jgi:hypothetical protein